MPALAALHFALVGLGITTDEALVNSATVSSNASPDNLQSCIPCKRSDASGAMRADACMSLLLQRAGSRQELLRGPFLYGAVIAGITAAYWRNSPIGVTAIAVLCAGDGLADIVGRRYGASNKLPHSPHKVGAVPATEYI